ncbi:transglutaminase domain-containing protein [Sporosarcina sp. FA9]|uniref:transglutaminase domain-containing protein n=1 Tax=Sporosarcina sp. FA9 TaxID=3413030 RepID=UPI003F65EA25
MFIKKPELLIVSLLSLFLLAACTNEPSPTNEGQQIDEQKPKNEFETAVKEKNAELERGPLELTSYGEEVGAKLAQPTYDNFAVNEFLTVEGTVEQHEQLKEKYVWIKIHFSGDTISDQSLEYYAPIKDGKFKQKATLFNGEGEYRVKVLLPSKDRNNYYYDLATFNVFNVNPASHRDITYSTFAQDANLTIQNPDSGYVIKNEGFTLEGKISATENHNEIMIELKKDGETWKHIIPVKNNKFTYDIPLFYGKGVHQLKVYIPDVKKSGYYQEGTTLYIDNESDLITDPITLSTAYDERGITLDSPTYGGEETELTYHVKGAIDKNAPFARETTHLYITTKKDGEEALAVIPVNEYRFDDEFYLRFGPGTYEVIVSVPEIKEENSSKFYYQGVAKFSVENTATEDQRDLLPSRGVQSDSPEIIAIANDLIKDTMSDREKAKAVYEYTAKTISYDVEKLKNDAFDWDDSALKVLNLKTGVCQDYAYLAIAILRAGGMEARYIAGTAGSGFNHARHAWVEVKVDNEWLTMDPTWGSGYVDKGIFVANYKEDYFDPTEEAFKSHFRVGVEY